MTDSAHARPDDAPDALVAAVGRLSEAFERVERARGALYDFHQLIGGADAMLDEVVEGLRGNGYAPLADRIEKEIVGRNVLPGRWTFEVVEEFDADYHRVWCALERDVREATMDGRRHVHEAELKRGRRR